MSASNQPNNVRDTSKEAFVQKKLNGQFTRQQRQILEALNNIQPATRKMIAAAIGTDSSNLSASFKNLIKLKTIRELPQSSECKQTGNRATYLEINPDSQNKKEVEQSKPGTPGTQTELPGFLNDCKIKSNEQTPKHW